MATKKTGSWLLAARIAQLGSIARWRGRYVGSLLHDLTAPSVVDLPDFAQRTLRGAA